LLNALELLQQIEFTATRTNDVDGSYLWPQPSYIPN
jgi:hypothetical protein